MYHVHRLPRRPIAALDTESWTDVISRHALDVTRFRIAGTARGLGAARGDPQDGAGGDDTVDEQGRQAGEQDRFKIMAAPAR
jgi:hypothetical protein